MVNGKFAGGGRSRSRPRPDELGRLSHQYEEHLKSMHELYQRADEVEEVNVMKVRLARRNGIPARH